MPVVWSDRHRLHEPGGEIWVGVRTPGTELPARAERIRERARRGRGALRRGRAAAGRRACSRSTTRSSSTTWPAPGRSWEAAGLTEDPGQDRVVPYLFPHPGLLGGRPPAIPAATTARAGQLRLRHDDPDRPRHLGGGAGRGRRGAHRRRPRRSPASRAAYACCRPPGHHATRGCFGGSCYLNNSAAAAARLCASALDGPVAVLDVDAHHGNGDPGDLLRRPRGPGRLGPRRPGRRLVPPLPRLRRPRPGAGAGAGANRNLPLAPGLRRRAVARGGRRARRLGRAQAVPAALVVPLGVDAAARRPREPAARSAPTATGPPGASLGALGLPTVVVQEGGYDLAPIGRLVARDPRRVRVRLGRGGRG